MLRCQEPGWVRIGVSDSTARRSLWARLDDGHTVLELCAGREGDDAYLQVAEGECQLWAMEVDE